MPSFFDLPVELREPIYVLVFTTDQSNGTETLTQREKVSSSSSSFIKQGLSARALMQVNQQCRAETSAMYYSTRRFKIHGPPSTVMEFLDTTGRNPSMRKTIAQMRDLISHDLVLPSPAAQRRDYEAVVIRRAQDGRRFHWFGVYVSNLEWCLAFQDAQGLNELKGRAKVREGDPWMGH